MSSFGPENDHAVAEAREPRKRKRQLFYWLLLVLLLLALILGFLLFRGVTSSESPGGTIPSATTPSAKQSSRPPTPATKGSSTGTMSPPSEGTSPPAPPDPPKIPTSATIEYFDVSPTVVYCNTAAPVPPKQYLHFSWSATDASSIGFGIETSDALSAGMGWDLPFSGTSEFHFPGSHYPYVYPCPQASQSYTLTVEGPAGKVSRTVTVTNKGDLE